MKKRICCLLLCAAVLCGVFCVSAGADGGAGLAFTYLQCDDRWKDVQVGTLNIVQSACGVATLCNAVYYLTGKEMDLVEVAFWANRAGLFNAGFEGSYRSIFYYSTRKYGEAYGYTASAFQGGDIRSRALVDHLLSGGTAALHVPGHFMAAVGYDPASGKYLIIDPMPGDTGRYDTRRKGLTHSDGDWLTAEQLSEGFIAVDGYALFSATNGSNARREALKTAGNAANQAKRSTGDAISAFCRTLCALLPARG